MGFAPVKPHGFPTFLHRKTNFFPTTFPKANAFLRVLPQKGRQYSKYDPPFTTNNSNKGGYTRAPILVYIVQIQKQFENKPILLQNLLTKV